MAVFMGMLMGMAVFGIGAVVVTEGKRHPIGLAGSRALALAQIAAVCEALHVVMVAVLGRPHLRFKAEHLGAVFAE